MRIEVNNSRKRLFLWNLIEFLVYVAFFEDGSLFDTYYFITLLNKIGVKLFLHFYLSKILLSLLALKMKRERHLLRTKHQASP